MLPSSQTVTVWLDMISCSQCSGSMRWRNLLTNVQHSFWSVFVLENGFTMVEWFDYWCQRKQTEWEFYLYQGEYQHHLQYQHDHQWVDITPGQQFKSGNMCFSPFPALPVLPSGSLSRWSLVIPLTCSMSHTFSPSAHQPCFFIHSAPYHCFSLRGRSHWIVHSSISLQTLLHDNSVSLFHWIITTCLFPDSLTYNLATFTSSSHSLPSFSCHQLPSFPLPRLPDYYLIHLHSPGTPPINHSLSYHRTSVCVFCGWVSLVDRNRNINTYPHALNTNSC